MHQAVLCLLFKSIHVDKGKIAMFNHLKHKCFHCSVVFSGTIPCVGVELVSPKPAVKLVTKQTALSNVVPVQSITCSAAALKWDAIGRTLLSKPLSALEYHMCDTADGANMYGAKTVSEYSSM